MSQRTSSYLLRLGLSKLWTIKTFYLYKSLVAVNIKEIVRFILFNKGIENFSTFLRQSKVIAIIFLRPFYVVEETVDDEIQLIKWFQLRFIKSRLLRLTFLRYKILCLGLGLTNMGKISNLYKFNNERVQVQLRVKKRTKVRKSLKRLRLKEFLRLKNSCFFIEYIIFSVFGKAVDVTLTNISCNTCWVAGVELPELFKKIIPEIHRKGRPSQKDLKYRKYFFYVMYITSLFNSGSILGRIITDRIMIEKAKNQKRVVSQFISNVKESLRLNIIYIYGLRLEVKGKIKGKLKSGHIRHDLGKTTLQKFESQVDFVTYPCFTKQGLVSVKLWLFGS